MHGSAQTQVPPGWEDAERAERLAARIPAETGFSTGAILPLCLRSADPDGALAGTVRALAARKERYGRPAPAASVAPLVLVCAGSRFLAQVLAARPRLVDLLACTRFPLRPTPLRASRCSDAGTLARRLRRVKQVEVLRIALRDLSGASVPEVTRDLSRLAASAFDAAVRFHYRRLCELHGPPAGRTAGGPSGFCVLGMGKLGGEELNFSSDADVLYVYDRDGRTEGANALDHFAFYARLAEAVTAAVGSPSATPEGGFVFRVDLDLRPEGRSGPIVNAIRGLELYYEAQGAAWERFALLKARPIAGNLAAGEAALRALQPFVFRKYFDLAAIDEMRKLKARAEKEAARVAGVDLKLGKGGIRENRVLRAGAAALARRPRRQPARPRDPQGAGAAALRGPRLQPRPRRAGRGLRGAAPAGAPRADGGGAADPRHPRRSARARAAGPPRRLPGRLDHGARSLAAPRTGGGAVPGSPAGCRRRRSGRGTARRGRGRIRRRARRSAQLRSRSSGFDQPEGSAEELARLARKRGTPFHDPHPLGPALITELAAAPDPDQALRHLADLFGTLADASAATRLLGQSPRTTRLLLSLFGSSDYLSRQLLRHPELIDQLVLRGAAALVRDKPDLEAELRGRLRALPLDDVEAALTELRRFRNEEVLRVGLHDVAGALDVEQVSRASSPISPTSAWRRASRSPSARSRSATASATPPWW